MGADTSMENISLIQDGDTEFKFCGRLFSECSWYDEENGILTRQKLYTTDDRKQVYYIVRSGGNERSRSLYQISVKDDICTINNGNSEMNIQFDMLMLAVRSLCGLDANATPSLDQVEEMLKAANG